MTKRQRDKYFASIKNIGKGTFWKPLEMRRIFSRNIPNALISPPVVPNILCGSIVIHPQIHAFSNFPMQLQFVDVGDPYISVVRRIFQMY